MGLKEEIAAKRKEIVVDSYPMSIGEVMNIYKDDELDVHPEFQRFFRWDEEQKTKLIESILLGIPIPPIFVSQKTDGKWDVIDGQQRLSTILQFLQVLKDDDGNLYAPLVLKGTKFLPSLENVRWDDEQLFSSDQKITFKREKLNFTIIKETADNDTAKYEMFQRLNTGGTHLSAQEIRNCLLIMINKPLYEVINSLHEDENFKSCTPLTDTQQEERYDLELVVRYLLYIFFSNEFLSEIDKSRSIDVFITEELENCAKIYPCESLDKSIQAFPRIFALLNESFGENSFKKYQDNKHKGAVMIAAYESIIPGLFLNLDYWEAHKAELKDRVQQLYAQDAFINATRRGTRALDRMYQLISFSRTWFANED